MVMGKTEIQTHTRVQNKLGSNSYHIKKIKFILYFFFFPICRNNSLYHKTEFCKVSTLNQTEDCLVLFFFNLLAGIKKFPA